MPGAPLAPRGGGMTRARVGVLISGRGSNLAALVEAAEAEDCPFRVALVVSNIADAPGLAIAAAHEIPQFALSHKGLAREAFDGIVDGALRDAHVDHVALAGYMRLLSPWFVERWRGRLVNIHPSLLPAHKGLHTHQRALDAGDARAGCTVHLVTEALDDGPILGRAEVPILPGDDADSLAARVLAEEHRLYPAVLAELVGRRA